MLLINIMHQHRSLLVICMSAIFFIGCSTSSDKIENASKDTLSSNTLVDSSLNILGKIFVGELPEHYHDTVFSLIELSIYKDSLNFKAWETKIFLLFWLDKKEDAINTIEKILPIFNDFKLYLMTKHAYNVEKIYGYLHSDSLYREALYVSKNGIGNQSIEYYCISKMYLLCKYDLDEDAKVLWVDTCSSNIIFWGEDDNLIFDCENILSMHF